MILLHLSGLCDRSDLTVEYFIIILKIFRTIYHNLELKCKLQCSCLLSQYLSITTEHLSSVRSDSFSFNLSGSVAVLS